MFFKAQAQQNLVPNPSFEVSNFIIDTLNFPGSDTSCLFYVGYPSNFVPPWSDISFATAMYYYDSCSYLNDLRVPYTLYGYQVPHSSKSFAALGLYGDSAETNSGSYFRRNYPFCKLTQTLKYGKKFCVEFFLNMPDSSNLACSNVGALFSVDSILATQIDILNQTLTPQINNNVQMNPLISQIDWIRVHGSFIANGNENYITIGNFTSQHLCDTNHLYTVSNYLNSYYFLDDVSVVELRANAYADDTTICSNTGFTKKLRVFDGMNNLQWSTGDTTQAIIVSQAGTYWVTATNECGTVTDTIKIKLLNPSAYKFNLGNDAFYCTNFSKQLSIINPNLYNIVWSTNDTIPSINITQPGTYWASAQSECGLQTDTIVMTKATLPTNIILQNDTTIYVGDSIVINAIDGLQQYQWSTGDTTQSLTISNFKFQILNVYAYTSDGCLVTDSIRIILKEKPSIELPIIVPNPQQSGKGNVFTILNLPSNSQVYVYDALGQVLLQSTNYNNNFSLDFSASALYYYKILLSNGEVINGKVVLE